MFIVALGILEPVALGILEPVALGILELALVVIPRRCEHHRRLFVSLVDGTNRQEELEALASAPDPEASASDQLVASDLAELVASDQLEASDLAVLEASDLAVLEASDLADLAELVRWEGLSIVSKTL